MPSLSQYFSDNESGAVAAENPTVRHALSSTKREELRRKLLSDSYFFTYLICRHRDMDPSIHMPISFAACGLADKLVWSLTQSGFDSYVIREYRKQFIARSIDLYNPNDLPKVDIALNFVNFCLFRGIFKSSVITHGGPTFTATRDPNSTQKLTSATNPRAHAFCSQIKETILSGLYHDLFPDRVPSDNLTENLTKERIKLIGRTISHPQPNIEASGLTATVTSAHYDTFWTDDLVVEENATSAYVPVVQGWLANMSGLYMETRRVRRIFAGTRWEDENGNSTDVYHYLTTGKNATNCLTLYVPIEIHTGDNLLERGTPTLHTYPPERISRKQDEVMSDPNNPNGVRSWYLNYLLRTSPAGGQLFNEQTVNDPERSWKFLGIKDPKKDVKDQFYVTRYSRNHRGQLLDKQTGLPIDPNTFTCDCTTHIRNDWRHHVLQVKFNPWNDLDRVIAVDFAWKSGGHNWGVTAAGIDYDGVAYQLETRSANTGLEGWVEALDEMEQIYRPRIIGFGAGGYQEVFVQLLHSDPRIKRMKNRFQKLSEQVGSKHSRIKAGVADPLKLYKWMLLPSATSDTEDDFGAQATRDEMIGYRNDPNVPNGILDSMWMCVAVAKRRPTDEQMEEEGNRYAETEHTYRRRYDPVLGVPV